MGARSTPLERLDSNGRKGRQQRGIELMHGTVPAVLFGGWRRTTKVDCTPASVPPVDEFRSARTASHMGLDHLLGSEAIELCGRHVRLRRMDTVRNRRFSGA